MTTGPKFIIVTDKMDYIDSATTHPYGVWLTDYMWYNRHQKHLVAWMIDNDVEMSGMIIKFRTDEDRTLFLLKWQ